MGVSANGERKLAYTPDKPVIERIMTTVASRLNISIDGKLQPRKWAKSESLISPELDRLLYKLMW